jgi:hypothetical protein
MITKKTIITAISAIGISTLLSFGVWALDSRMKSITEESLDRYQVQILEPKFITIGQLKEFVKEQNRAQLQQRVDELQLKDNLNLTTEYEKALLEQLERKLDR